MKIKVEQLMDPVTGLAGWFFASVEGVRGLLSFGPTEAETLTLLKVAERLWVEAGGQVNDGGSV